MNKVVLVTGASSGIGKVTAGYLSQKGFKVYGSCRNPKQATEKFELIPLDLTKSETIYKAIEYIIEKEGRIDVVINNAGTGITGAIEETPSAEIKKAYEINLFGAIEVMKAVLPQMRKQRSGLIINVTSIAGYMGLPFRGIYSSIKASLAIITESLRMEVKEFGIHIANIAPGDFNTNIAGKRYHTPVFKDSDYKDSYKKNLRLINQNVDHGRDPELVARQIYRIINTKNPGINYKVGGFLEKFSIVLKRILPDEVYERLFMWYYGM